MALVLKNLPATAGEVKRCKFDPQVGKTPLEKEMATHSSILAWEIPWTEEPGVIVHGVTKSWTQLKQLSTHTHMSIFPDIFISLAGKYTHVFFLSFHLQLSLEGDRTWEQVNMPDT